MMKFNSNSHGFTVIALFTWNARKADLDDEIYDINEKLKFLSQKQHVPKRYETTIELKASQTSSSKFLQKINADLKSSERRYLAIKFADLEMFILSEEINDFKQIDDRNLHVYAQENEVEVCSKENLLSKSIWRINSSHFSVQGTNVSVGVLTSSSNAKKCAIECIVHSCDALMVGAVKLSLVDLVGDLLLPDEVSTSMCTLTAAEHDIDGDWIAARAKLWMKVCYEG